MDEALQATSHSKNPDADGGDRKRSHALRKLDDAIGNGTLRLGKCQGWGFFGSRNLPVKERLEHIYDFAENKIKYYVPRNCYLFGASDDWLIYVLELCNDRFYIGSCKHLGKALGEHFSGKGIAWTQENPVTRVLEVITVKPGSESYLELKSRLVNDYILQYGWKNVLGGQMPKRTNS